MVDPEEERAVKAQQEALRKLKGEMLTSTKWCGCPLGTPTVEFCYTGKDADGLPSERSLNAHTRSCAALFLRGLVRRGTILYPEDWDLELREA